MTLTSEEDWKRARLFENDAILKYSKEHELWKAIKLAVEFLYFVDFNLG